MGQVMSMLLILVVLTAVSLSSQQAGLVQQTAESHVVPLKTISKLSMDKSCGQAENGERSSAYSTLVCALDRLTMPRLPRPVE